jgi:integrase
VGNAAIARVRINPSVQPRGNQGWSKRLTCLAHPSPIRTQSLLDNKYDIELSPDGTFRDGRITIDFDQIVAPGAQSMLSPRNWRDLLTSKIFVILSVSPNDDATSSATTLSIRFRDLLTMIRVRNASGLTRMSSLRKEHFEKFVRDLQYGVEGVLPLHERAKSYVENLAKDGRNLPTYGSQESGGPVVAWTKIAQQLGLSRSHSLSPEARLVLLRYLALSDPKLHAAEMSRLKLEAVEQTQLLTNQRISALLHPWALLWNFRPYMTHDPIGVQAFSGLETRHSIARSVGRDVERTEDIPPYQACYLLDRALTWVYELAPTILELLKVATRSHNATATVRYGAISRDIEDTLKACADKGAFAVRVSPSYQKGKFEISDGVTVRELAYNLLPAACFIVISTFTARREGELVTLTPDCVEEEGDELWLLSWIEKTLRRLDRTPIPPSVKKAIDTLRQLQEVTKDLGTPKRLFEFIEPVPTRRKVYFEPNEAIARFAEVVAVPPLADGSPCRFATHMFRRFFCISYYYRYDYPVLLALSFHLRHLDLEMTKKYLSSLVTGRYIKMLDKKRASKKAIEAAKKADLYRDARRIEFEKDRINILARKFRQVASGALWIGGRGGDRLVAELNQLLNEIGEAIVITQDGSASDQRIDSHIIEFAKAHWFEPHPDRHSFCGCGPSIDDCSVAQCLVAKQRAEGRDAIVGANGPDLAYADRYSCATCIHNIQTRETVPEWFIALSSEEEQELSAPTAAMRELAAENIMAIKGVLIRCASTANAPNIDGLERFARR